MKLMTALFTSLFSVRFLVVAGLCISLVFSNVVPTLAAGKPFNHAAAGTTQMNQVLDKSEDTLDAPPMSLKEVEKRANEGLNEVQGDADKDKMYKSRDSRPAIVGDLEKALDKATKN